MNKPKILLFDIETRPNLAFVWGKYEQNVIDYQEEWSILCYCWKWLDEKTVHSESMKDHDSEASLIDKAWDLFNEADVIIAHNGDQFDIKKMNAKFLEHGFRPPAPYKTVDTKKVAKAKFSFNSNKLDDLGELLGLGRKVDTGGFELWLGCMRNEEAAWKLMVKYCKQDVLLTEKVYYAMRPWMTNHPNSNVYTGHSHNCPNCGSHQVQARGFATTRVGKRQRYQCQADGCGAWSQGEVIKAEVKTVLR